MVTYSEDFAGGATTANTLLTLTPTAGWQVPPGSFVIYRARVGLAGIVNAKECAGVLIIEISGQGGGTWAFAVGAGSTGATNSSAKPADKVDMSIPIRGGQIVKVKILTAEVSNDQRVGLQYMEGGGAPCMTLVAGGAGQDLTAGTAKILTVDTLYAPVNMTPYRDGRIKQIRLAGCGVIDALAAAVRVRLIIPGMPDMFKFIMRSGASGAATAAAEVEDVIDNLDIPVKQNQTVQVELINTATTAQAILSGIVSLLCM